MSARFQPGELVDVVIKGAQVSDKHAQDRHLHLHVGEETFHLPVRMLDRVQLTRVAPAEWPPQVRDVWADSHGGEWWGRPEHQGSSDVYLQSQKGGVDDPAWVLRQHGPMTLVYRKGWTPAPAGVVEQADEPKVDERGELIAGLREFVDFVEAHPDLPIDRWTLNVYRHVRNEIADEHDQEAAFAELRRTAAILGVEPDLRDEPNAPHPHAVKHFRGGVEYKALYVTDAYRRGFKPVDPATDIAGVEEVAGPVAAGSATAPNFDLSGGVEALRMHLASEHAARVAVDRDAAELRDLHEHEHRGPGTIRNHDAWSLHFDTTKAERNIAEYRADDQAGADDTPGGGAS